MEQTGDPGPCIALSKSLIVFCIKDAPKCMQSGAYGAECSGLSRAILVLRDEACAGIKYFSSDFHLFTGLVQGLLNGHILLACFPAVQ